MKAIILILIIFANNAHAFSFDSDSCPDLSGFYIEDDFGIHIVQHNCKEITLKGLQVLSSDINYKNLKIDSIERECHFHDNVTKYCKAEWINNDLVISSRTKANEIKNSHKIIISRCDYVTPTCFYGTYSPKDSLQLNLELYGQILLPKK